MSNLKFFLLLVVISSVFLVIGCSGSPDTLTQPEPVLAPERDSLTDGRVILGTYKFLFNPDEGTVSVLPNRELANHFNVTGYVKPPMCYDCVQIVGSYHNFQAQEWTIGVLLKNPSVMPGFDVRGLVFNLGNKWLKNADGYMTKYLQQDISFKAFAKLDPVRAFWPLTSGQENYTFHFPPGSGWATVDYIVDTSFPGNAKEPILENISFPYEIENGWLDQPLTLTAFDYQGDFFVVQADLSPIGGDPEAVLWDDGQHSDGDMDDGVFGIDNLKASAAEGEYIIKVRGYDIGLHYGFNSFRVKITGGVINDDPIIDEITIDRTTVLKNSTTEKVTVNCIAHDPNGNDMYYHWSADGGTFDNPDVASTQWKSPGTVDKYYLTCEVTDDFGGYTSGQSPKVRVTQYTVMLPAPGPDFTCEKLLESGSFKLSDYCPGNVTMLNFWATWCGPCVGEMPILQQIFDGYDGEAYAQLLLAGDSEKATSANWVKANSYTCTMWGWDGQDNAWTPYQGYSEKPGYIPYTVILDADGNVRFQHVGSISSPLSYTTVIDELI